MRLAILERPYGEVNEEATMRSLLCNNGVIDWGIEASSWIILGAEVAVVALFVSVLVHSTARRQQILV